MTTNTDPNVQIIENARLGDIRPGDRVTRKYTWEDRDATCTHIREGIAHHRGADGNWRTEDGAWITYSDGEGITITIRRTAPTLPTEAGEVIVAADGREFIEAEFNGKTFFAREAMRGEVHWLAAWRTGTGRLISRVGPECITPGTWKKADK